MDLRRGVYEEKLSIYHLINLLIQFFEGNTEESKPLVPPVEEKEDTISSFPKTIITSDGNKNKQRLLQTNDTINYSMSLIGFLLFFYAIYQLRRNLK
jgi:hypothetical protein